ncbi:tyrosine-protein kinase (capsular polysaccharide biosynthesis) [Lacticaseibacillus paracasei subsp. paracasei CNCM I-4648]|uniref:CpsD/CapB family tyrosine-protein kinase n=1 Tax=Lacticaseibacillus paracasei TaxID=1597 RepID=UPI0003434DFF|nr:CpsD/CapB family tyrosine-protein kinase [Lacticaseibacillus paracasei]EPD03703.1 tyrosine-protein kinase (capsular polysaccharide biosynthesis) [Lacticaseibacillus paracasei subsp. paracasei CNCM I-4648]MDM7549275.1 CpsD/CapB family tyrosine-protein kinase [Lacticaseibacillus paracasei]RNE28591.1 Tyrosine-protein kinase YwqD [Lacticaseibacillus paracasei]WCZ15858.1 CpsD/CapB family tyrosine-protein kinase [Lacticaseibacillus paracasei]
MKWSLKALLHRQKVDQETQKNGVMLVTYAEPKHVVSEQFRTVRTNIEFAGAALDHCQVVMFTSSAMSEGKSTVSANVAVTWAQAGKKVLLIDADLRRPTVHATFRKLNLDGVTTVLTGKNKIDEVVEGTFVNNLSIISSGPVPPNPSELLNSKRMADLLKWARDKFDIVVLDAPPVLAVSDVQVLVPQTDGVVVVANIGKTLKGDLRRTVEVLKLAKATILGSVERVKAKHGDRGYGYGYGYGYGNEKS